MKFDVGKNEIASIKHGWCRNSEGIPLIWMPLLHWLLNGQQGYSPSAALWKQWEKFAYALAKIAEYRRLLIESVAKGGSEFNDSLEAHFFLPVIVEYALGLTKRIVSSSIDALIFREVFKDRGNISRRTRKFLTQIENLKLIKGNSNQFVDAWKSINSWYWEIADSDNVQDDTEKGIRDLLEHRNVVMQIHLGAVGDHWYCDLCIINKNCQILRKDVLKYLKRAVHGLCQLYDRMYESLGIKDSIKNESEINWVLPYGQVLLLFGKSDDYIAFWPSFG